PYAPPVGQAGSSAMHKDSSAFVSWAEGCRVTRGYQDLSDTSLGLVTVGDSAMATGKALVNGIVSLGDGGSATCTFKNTIKNGPGFDFAVFENGFNDTFLELAFVEVSSDGINFTRFASHSLSDTLSQFGNAAVMDATKLNNLAGKYKAAYGTPFDLQELSGSLNLDINAVSHVRVVDVVGSLMKAYATYDSYGNKINDPWPTGFPPGGFDLDAIGVIHENSSVGAAENNQNEALVIYPNPIRRSENFYIKSDLKIISFQMIDCLGKISINCVGENKVETASLYPGVYCLQIITEKGTVIKKVIVN
ncbi:MAG TPA: T9SS type A sorting domain-containing protein, partial [Bacteroidia bacterium]|nr:T9SS type A sorting domain-containing protein [Bacteroidia bacterium]